MPSVQDTINIAKLSLAMARVDVDKSSFRGPVLDYLLPVKIMVLKKAVEWAFAQSATYDNLDKTANFLYAMCDKYGVLATNSLNIQTAIDGGPVVGVVTAVPVFPIYKDQSDFTTATFCPDTRLFGNELQIWCQHINRNLEASEYSVNGLGLTIVLDGFDATVPGVSYGFLIHKING